jgi:hypothetical protein
MRNALPIPSTFNVIAKCWENAELELRSVIEKKYHDLDEECITTLFYGELAFTLREASQKKEIERAFLADLHKAFPQRQFSGNLAAISANLIADVSLHKHAVEKITGGDFGLTLTRPQLSWRNRSELARSEYQRSLLCQAKLKRRNGKWGKLTRRQKDVFPSRMNYLTLLLYSYADPERHCLNPFKWQVCQSIHADNVENWLKRDEFPSVVHSTEVIRLLGNARIGTDDQETITNVIRPHSRPYLHIRIFWPHDKEPPSCFQVQAVRQVAQQLQQLQQRG